ncbi:MAG: WecB/TagA/CpsF family glycosyltransferase [Acidobacteriaceae bacterium]
MEDDMHDTVALFGLPIANQTMDETVSRIEGWIDSGETCQIATANLDFVRNAMLDKQLHQVICECSLVLPDGAPLIWASRLIGKPLRERVTGVDLVPRLAELSARRGFSIYFLGSDERNSKRAQEALQRAYPGLRIAGWHSPEVLPLGEMDNEDILGRIRQAAPDILLVAFGNPKQELWIHANRACLDGMVAIGIGGSLEIIAGSVKRAPQWAQSMSLEWIFRMGQEPLRLFPRYCKDALALARLLPVSVAVSSFQPGKGKREPGLLFVRELPGARFLTAPTDVQGSLCAAIIQEAVMASRQRQIVVVDFSATRRVEADALGALLVARRTLLAAGQRLCLVGMNSTIRRVIQFSELGHLLVAASPEVMNCTSADIAKESAAATALVAERPVTAASSESIHAQTAVSA